MSPRLSARYPSARKMPMIGAEGLVMATKRRRAFDMKSFLARVGDGRSIGKYRKGQVVFSQGDPGDAVFYIQKGKAKLTVVSEQGKEAVIRFSVPTISSARDALRDRRGVLRRSRP